MQLDTDVSKADMKADPTPNSLTPDQLHEWLQRTHGFSSEDL
jgi:hypothetical protein